MKNKTIILTAEYESIMKGKQGEKYIQYAKENKLSLIAELHYSFVMPFSDPERFVEEVMKAKPDIILTDDEMFLYANLYHDGKIAELFEEKGVTVLHMEIEMELSKLNEQFDDEFKARFKNAVHYAFAKTFSQESAENLGQNLVIISNGTQKDEMFKLIDHLKSNGTRDISYFVTAEFDENMTEKINQVIKEKDISSIIIYENGQMNKTLADYLSTLICERNIDVYFGEQIQDDMEISQRMQMN